MQGSGSAAGREILLLWEVEHRHNAVVSSLSDPIFGTSRGSAVCSLHSVCLTVRCRKKERAGGGHSGAKTLGLQTSRAGRRQW